LPFIILGSQQTVKFKPFATRVLNSWHSGQDK